jgi:hypothetical protein
MLNMSKVRIFSLYPAHLMNEYGVKWGNVLYDYHKEGALLPVTSAGPQFQIVISRDCERYEDF